MYITPEKSTSQLRACTAIAAGRHTGGPLPCEEHPNPAARMALGLLLAECECMALGLPLAECEWLRVHAAPPLAESKWRHFRPARLVTMGMAPLVTQHGHAC